MTDELEKGEDLVEKAKADRKRARGPIGRSILFVRQIIAELKKVTRPTVSELRNYTLVVLGFVTVVMIIIAGLDYGFASLVMWAFTPTGTVAA
jgi:preprotein translocase subunit SecE